MTLPTIPAPLLESIKEFFRVIVLAIIPVVIAGLMLPTPTVDFRLIAVTAAVAILRGIDKWLHEQGKATDNTTMTGGLTRF